MPALVVQQTAGGTASSRLVQRDTVLAAHDPTQLMLPDAHAPLVTISIEEQAFASALPLARIPYWEPRPSNHRVLGCYGPSPGQGTRRPCHLPCGCQPVRPAWNSLPCSAASWIPVARSLMVQLQCVTDVPNTPCHGYAAAHCVCVPAAACGCLPSHPPDTTAVPTIAPAALPPDNAGWLCVCLYPARVLSCMVRFGPLPACAHSGFSPHLFMHSQVPQMRCLVHIRLPGTVPRSTTAGALVQAG